MADISVLICTRDRSRSLGRVLHALAASEPSPRGSWEVVVVDNGSVDDTKDIVGGIAEDYPVPLTYLQEPRAGKSHALNTGVTAARGEIVMFTDDDVEIPPEWLSAITAPFSESGCDGVVGRVLPRFTHEVPDWLPVDPPWNLTGGLLTLDLGEEAIPSPVPPLGANMAYRRRTLHEIGPFDTTRGPGTELPFGEDTEYWYRARAAGAEILYVPAATIRHPLGPDRVNRRSLRRWYRDAGRSRAGFYRPPKNTVLWRGVPRHMYRELGAHLLQSLARRGASRRFYHRVMAEFLIGLMSQLWARSGRAPAGSKEASHPLTIETHGAATQDPGLPGTDVRRETPTSRD